VAKSGTSPTRLAYVEVLPDERKATAAGFVIRALRWFRNRGMRVERIMTDNGAAYVSKLWAKTLRRLAIRHLRTRPYTPRTNGKAERFIQTLLREWAYAHSYPEPPRIYRRLQIKEGLESWEKTTERTAIHLRHARERC